MRSNFSIGVALGPQKTRQMCSKKCLEHIFDLYYLDHLRCQNWRLERWVNNKSDYLAKNDLIADLPKWLGALHKNEIENPKVDHLTISWIGEEIGYGLYTEKSLQAWSYVGEYAGILRQRGLFGPTINDYCFLYPYLGCPWKLLTVDSEKWGNYTRFINHSDTPNLESYSFFYQGKFRLGFRSLKDIRAGEQLTYDYGEIYWRHRTKI